MKFLSLQGYGAPLDVISAAEAPRAEVRHDELRVKMVAAPINPSDLLLVRGYYAIRPSFPYALGAEGVGRVVEMGADVDASLAGRAVLILPTYEVGTWAEEIVVSARHVVPVPDGADPIQLAMLGINPVTAFLLLSRFTTLMPGDWIAQTGANSAMGQYVIAFAKLMGVRTLNVVRRAEVVASVRGDAVVVAGDTLGAQIGAALGGAQLSLVLDNIGGEATGELAKHLKTGGTCVGYGVESGELPKIAVGDLYLRNLRLQGFWLINWLRTAPRSEIEEVYARTAELVRSGVLSATVEAEFPLGEYRAAITRATESGRSGKVLFRF